MLMRRVWSQPWSPGSWHHEYCQQFSFHFMVSKCERVSGFGGENEDSRAGEKGDSPGCLSWFICLSLRPELMLMRWNGFDDSPGEKVGSPGCQSWFICLSSAFALLTEKFSLTWPEPQNRHWSTFIMSLYREKLPQNQLPADMVTSPTQSGEWLTGNGHNEPRPCPLLAPASGNATCRVLEQGSITAWLSSQAPFLHDNANGAVICENTNLTNMILFRMRWGLSFREVSRKKVYIGPTRA